MKMLILFISKKISGYFRICIFVYLFCNATTLQAQYVIVPDTIFSEWIQNKFPNCINKNKLDTTCSEIVNLRTMVLFGASNLEGLQYFKNLDTLIYENGNFVLNFVPSFPSKIHYLDLEGMCLTSLPTLPDSLQNFVFRNSTRLIQLPKLPDAIVSIVCNQNSLISFTNLPKNLQYLDCTYNNMLTSFPAFPLNLTYLNCSRNSLTDLPLLPNKLSQIYCNNNSLQQLPELPSSLYAMICSGNYLNSLPTLPKTLKYLDCSYNLLQSLPLLNDSLQTLLCQSNQLRQLPQLSSFIYNLNCSQNNLSTLPMLPKSLRRVDCSNNQLTSLPEFPSVLYSFLCSSNPNLFCFPQLKKILGETDCSGVVNCEPCRHYGLDFSNTGISCIPNYSEIPYSNPTLNTFPLCNSQSGSSCSFFTTAVDKIEQAILFSISPNPAKNQIVVKLESQEIGDVIRLYNINGQSVLELKIEVTEFVINIEKIPAGFYTISISDGAKVKRVKKLIVE